MALSVNLSPAHPGEGRDPLVGRLDVFVYRLASKPYGTLHIGLTADLTQRVSEHKGKLAPGFTAKYGVDRLVSFAMHEHHAAALRREKRIKAWKRAWKIKPDRKRQPELARFVE